MSSDTAEQAEFERSGIGDMCHKLYRENDSRIWTHANRANHTFLLFKTVNGVSFYNGDGKNNRKSPYLNAGEQNLEILSEKDSVTFVTDA